MTITNLRLPNAQWCPVSYRNEAGTFTGDPLGWILHTQDGYGPLYDFFNGLKSPGRKFSHAWVGKDGKGQQYAELNVKSWANSPAGNGTYWAFESEGKGNEPLTQPQIETFALWHHFLPVQDTLANKNGEKGIGVHNMIIPTACPGAIRSGQRSVIIKVQKPLTRPPVVYGPVGPKLIAPAFPYSPQHYFGKVSPDPFCHSGTYSATDRQYIRSFQNKLLLREWKIGVDGIFGPQTESVIRAFQKEKFLVVSGKVGTQTYRSIWEAPVT